MAKKNGGKSLIWLATGVVLGAILYRMGTDIYDWAKFKWKNRNTGSEEITLQ